MSVPTWVLPSGLIFKENLRNRFSLTGGCPEVLSMVPFLHILNRWVLSVLFSLSLWRVSLVKTNQWQEAFFWPIAISDLCCNIGRMHWTEPRPETNVIHKAISPPRMGLRRDWESAQQLLNQLAAFGLIIFLLSPVLFLEYTLKK
jgi:hypothetical protein